MARTVGTVRTFCNRMSLFRDVIEPTRLWANRDYLLHRHGLAPDPGTRTSGYRGCRTLSVVLVAQLHGFVLSHSCAIADPLIAAFPRRAAPPCSPAAVGPRCSKIRSEPIGGIGVLPLHFLVGQSPADQLSLLSIFGSHLEILYPPVNKPSVKLFL